MAIGAFYQCWKHSAATIKVVQDFRKFYPDSTLYLVSDNAHDYTELAKEYNCLYEHGNENTNMFFREVKPLRIFFQRFARAMNSIQEEWCMILEDDVLIKGKYNESEFQAEMNGYKQGNVIWGNVIQYIRLFQPQLDTMPYGGFGGCVIHVPFFRKVFNDNPERHMEFLFEHTSWGTLYPNFDIILSILGYIYGGKTSFMNQIRQSYETNPHAVVVHAWKELYDKDPFEEDKHLVILKK